MIQFENRTSVLHFSTLLGIFPFFFFILFNYLKVIICIIILIIFLLFLFFALFFGHAYTHKLALPLTHMLRACAQTCCRHQFRKMFAFILCYMSKLFILCYMSKLFILCYMSGLFIFRQLFSLTLLQTWRGTAAARNQCGPRTRWCSTWAFVASARSPSTRSTAPTPTSTSTSASCKKVLSSLLSIVRFTPEVDVGDGQAVRVWPVCLRP